ncbi:hypothetical protein [Curvivirga aplysinae]|uniref:hypothetical protein n=1 Tax=Curvivirga aplysinae TaxID=2529852 RepID=UPI0012BCACD3|nr:hypothetical protein [Curvivirga aplysinae]MTI08976.1 hypothetical protein [Curvivirga aplysinae]
MFKHFLAILCVFIIAACGEIPRPYKTQSEDEKLSNILIIPDDARGIYYQTSDNEDDQRFASLLIERLAQYNIPVTQTDSLDKSYHLSGSIVHKEKEIRYVWDFFDNQYDELKTKETALPISSDVSKNIVEQQLANQIALQVAITLKPDVIDALNKQQNLNNISVKLLRIVGAPGDGNIALKRNIISILKKARIKIVEDTARADLVISGAILVKQLNDTQDQVRIDWLFQDHLGNELRSIKQQNNIPHGQLNERWGDTAYIIAVGVVQDAALTLDELLLQRAN